MKRQLIGWAVTIGFVVALGAVAVVMKYHTHVL